MSAQIFDAIISSVSVLLLAAIGRSLLGVRRDFRLFMQEHLWLLSTALWNRDMVMRIMRQLGMPIENLPPSDLPNKRS